MSNFVKFQYVSQPGTVARIINSNPKIEELAKEWQAASFATPQQFTQTGEFSDGEDYPEGDFSEGEFSEGIMAEEVSVMPEVTPEQLIAAAEDEAARILEEANANAERIANEANEKAVTLFEEHRAAAIEEGKAAADAYLEEQLANQEASLSELRNALEEEYASKHAQMEGEIVDVISEVLKKNFGMFLYDEKQILLHLVKKTIYGIESSKSFKIRVSPNYVGTLIGNIEEIKSELGSDVNIDVAHDDSLSDGDCIIETEYGVYHCGIDLQLDNLIAQMKALSQ